MEYFYHYTSVRNWENIKKEGLKPGKSLVGKLRETEDIPELAKKPVIFGLSSPAPESWLRNDDNTDYPVLKHLLDAVSRLSRKNPQSRDDVVLLKIRLLPGDSLYVSDFESIWNAQTNGYADEKVLANYYSSIAKLQGHFNLASKKIPEILCFDSIPPERIELVEKIPTKTYEEISAYIDRKKAEIETAAPAPASSSQQNFQQPRA